MSEIATVSSLSVVDAEAQVIVVAILQSPPERPLLANAVATLKMAFDSASAEKYGAAAVQLHKRIGELANVLPISPHDLQVLMCGRISKYPVWAILTSRTKFTPLALRLIAAEFLMAFTLGRKFRRSIAERAKDLAGKPNETTADLHYVARIEADALRQCLASAAGTPRRILLINNTVNAAIAVELQSRDPIKRQGASGQRTLALALVREVATQLYADIKRGDDLALVIAIAFVTGLPWSVALVVPLAACSDRRHTAVVDIQLGIVRLNLDQLLGALAQPRSGCVPSTTEVNRPLPGALADMLRRAHAANPTAQCLGDLLANPHASGRLPGFGPSVTVPRFLSSRGAAALEAGINRPLAAYAVGAFSLLGPARLHYLSVTPVEINLACSQLYAWLGWSAPVQTDAEAIVVGSAVTPTQLSIQTLDAHHKRVIEELRVSKRTTLEALIEFHNAYAIFCTHRTAFLTLARASKEYKFSAADWSSGSDFGILVDKAAGPWRGATPLPIPNLLALQLELWCAHIEALDRRLQKFGWDPESPVRLQIERILGSKATPLFFLVTGDCSTCTPGSVDVFSAEETAGLKHDAYRNYMSNELRRAGLGATVVDAISRHTVPHASVFSMSSTRTPLDWLREAAHALDQVAAGLGMKPIPGLRKLSK